MDNLEIVLNLPARHVNTILLSLGKQPLEAVIEAFVAVRQQADKQTADGKVEGAAPPAE